MGVVIGAAYAENGLAPRGAGGLKSSVCWRYDQCIWSRPARGGWIEIQCVLEIRSVYMVSPREGRVD